MARHSPRSRPNAASAGIVDPIGRPDGSAAARSAAAACGRLLAVLTIVAAVAAGCVDDPGRPAADDGATPADESPQPDPVPTSAGAASTPTGPGGADGPVGSGSTAGSGGPVVSVARPIDGDSLELRIDTEIVEVRLLGINAPESADCQGTAARDALMELLASGPITVDDQGTDRYGRRLVELDVGGRSVNHAMVAQGWALAIHGEGDHHVRAMVAAADGRLGWWAGAVGDCPALDADVRVIDARPDPSGRDEDHLNEEWVALGNFDDAPVDLTGWMLRDESTGNRFTFGPFTLEPGAGVVVRTGCGEDSADQIHWCSRSPVWSNQGETVMLMGPEGTYVSHLFLEDE